MSLETKLDKRLWSAIAKSYEERNFSSAVLEGIQFLGDLIREKTNLESDGVNLVGEAFGGKSPKLRVNRLETETEQNVQGGVEHLFRGIYRALRNPRSHEKITDSQEDADAILLFLDYLLRIIDKSKSKFDRSKFIERVFDEHFVEREEYANMLAKEVPGRYQYDLLLEIFRARSNARSYKKLRLIIVALWDLLTMNSKAEFAAALSEELNTIDRNDLVRVISALPDDVWNMVTQVARLRTENQLISSMNSGTYNQKTRLCNPAGVLGTWYGHLFPKFIMLNELQDVVVAKLGGVDHGKSGSDYIFTFILPKLIRSIDDPSVYLGIALAEGLNKGDVRYKHALLPLNEKNSADEYIYPKWRQWVADELASFKEQEISFDESEPF